MAQRYRFFSYGDAMLLTRQPRPRGAARSAVPTALNSIPHMLNFELLTTDGNARRGRVTQPRRGRDPDLHAGRHLRLGQGDVATELNEINSQIILGNTFHRWLRPGLEVVEAHGGLHRFMAGTSRILTGFRRASRVFRWARCARSPRRRVTFAPRRSTATSCSCRPRSRCGDPAHAGTRHRDAVRRVHASTRSKSSRHPCGRRRPPCA
ncbi:hypothetical protein ACU4GD_35460 [Cupriavidus basilensis]